VCFLFFFEMSNTSAMHSSDERIKKMDVPSSLVEKFELELKEFNKNLDLIQREYTKNVTRLPCKFRIETKYAKDDLMRLALVEFMERKKLENVSIVVNKHVDELEDFDLDADDFDQEIEDLCNGVNKEVHWYEVECRKRKKCRCVDCGCVVEDDI